SIVST
ncbi:hypothetical protein VCHENC02_2981B, partial [Vibrio harveyi]